MTLSLEKLGGHPREVVGTGAYKDPTTLESEVERLIALTR